MAAVPVLRGHAPVAGVELSVLAGEAGHRGIARLDSHAVTTTPEGNQPDSEPADEHHRSAGEELEWIGAEVEARPKVQFWIWIGIAAVVIIVLIIIIVTAF